MKEEIFKKVAEIISANNNIPVESITMDSTFEDLNMDSLDGLALINDLETNYNISIPNEYAMKIRSVRETVDNLERFLIMQHNETK